MRLSAGRVKEIKDYVAEHVEDHPKDIVRLTAEQFSLTRQAVSRYAAQMVAGGLLNAEGTTRARSYSLLPLASHDVTLEVGPSLREDVVWREHVAPVLRGIQENHFRICEYGFNEMMNNVISHSESPVVSLRVQVDAGGISLSVIDFGVGIFNKIQRHFNLYDPRDALLELAKGKMTSDQVEHTGEGIFFTSRMFSRFSILSSGLFFARRSVDGEDWLLELDEEANMPGTSVNMRLSLSAEHTVGDVIARYSSEFEDYGFTRTHVPLKLAIYGDEQLVSRSQARRILQRFDRFKEVILDFKDIESIGAAFADEIFRVFQAGHEEILIVPINANVEVQRMVVRAKTSDAAPA